ncbi:MAG TPA: thioredoxin [Gemmatimonadaceae bacterium]|nr:thioredoxin [Gemmatimonadaceae bacterium]
MSHPIHVTDATFAQEVEQHPGLTVVDFWATWCGPCRMIAPALEQLAAEYDGKVRIAKLDADQNVRTTARFNVRSMPTLMFFKGGKPVGQIVGAVPKAKIEAAIQQFAGLTATATALTG